MRAFLLDNDTDFEQSHAISWDSSEGKGLFEPELTTQSKTDLKKFSYELVDNGEWPDFVNMGSGYRIVSQGFRDLLDSFETEKPAYQFLKPNFLTDSAPQYYIMNLLVRLRPFPNGEPKTMSRWTFDKTVVGACKSIFRADESGTPAVCGLLAEKIYEAKFKGLWLMEVPLV